MNIGKCFVGLCFAATAMAACGGAPASDPQPQAAALPTAASLGFGTNENSGAVADPDVLQWFANKCHTRYVISPFQGQNTCWKGADSCTCEGNNAEVYPCNVHPSLVLDCASG